MTSADETKKTIPSSEDGAIPPKKRKRKRKAKKPVAQTTTNEQKVAEQNNTVSPEAVVADASTTPTEALTPSSNEKVSTATTTTKPNIDIKSDDHMLPGIEDISAYIARTKSSQPEKKEQDVSLILPDGTDLTALPNVYAIVPHTKGDHKIVYLTQDAPAGLVDDPRHRTPGEMYVKNGRSIYMVTLVMKEHPTLKDAHGEPYDIWLIDSPEQLTAQLQAIKAGVGGGENFGEPLIISSILQTKSSSTKESIGTETTSLQSESDTLLNEPQLHTDNTIAEEIPLPEPTAAFDLPEASIPDLSNVDTTAQEEQIDITTSLPGADIESDVGSESFTLPEQDITTDIILPESSREELPQSNETDATALDIPSVELPDTTPLEPEMEVIPEPISLEESSHDEHVSDTASDAMDLTMDIQATETPITLSSPEVELPQIDTNIPESTSPISLDPLDASELPVPEMVIGDTEERSSFLHPSNTATLHEENMPMDTESSEDGHMRFGSTTNTYSAAESQGASTSEQGIESGSMFHADTTTPSTDVSESSSSDAITGDTPRHTLPTHEQVTTEQPAINAEPLQPTPIVSETSQETNGSLNLDDLHIDDNLPPSPSGIETTTPAGTLNLDTIQTSEEEIITREVTSTKKKFPTAIIARLVLFFVIIGALILIWKVMFPAIKGSKPTVTENENTPIENTIPSNENTNTDPTDSTTGSGQNNNEPAENQLLPTDQEQPTDTLPTPEDTQPDNTIPTDQNPSDSPSAQLTLPELKAKLETQQIDARKLLNVAKLLEQKQAIKFSLAAMLKAGNVLERIETEPTITAEDVLQESQKIDAYLSEASKLVE